MDRERHKRPFGDVRVVGYADLPAPGSLPPAPGGPGAGEVT
jgi:hypothetical protein